MWSHFFFKLDPVGCAIVILSTNNDDNSAMDVIIFESMTSEVKDKKSKAVGCSLEETVKNLENIQGALQF